MKNLIYYNKNKCDVYFKKMSNRYEKANKSGIYIKDIEKFNVKNSIVTFEVKNFLIKSLCMPLDNYINERVLNSLKFYFNDYNDNILYDYFLLDSDLEYGQVKILLYAIKIQEDMEEMLKYIDRSYLVIRPLQFILIEYLTNKFEINKGIFLNKLEDGRYNVIFFKNSLILFNDYINSEDLRRLDSYLEVKIEHVKNEFNIELDKRVYFLNDRESKEEYDYKFKFDFLSYTMEEVLTKHDYIRSKFSKFWKKKESFKKNA